MSNDHCLQGTEDSKAFISFYIKYKHLMTYSILNGNGD